MSHQSLNHFLAYVVIVGATFLWVIDILVEFNVSWALRIKWSLFWTAVRYLTGIAAVILSLYIIF